MRTGTMREHYLKESHKSGVMEFAHKEHLRKKDEADNCE